MTPSTRPVLVCGSGYGRGYIDAIEASAGRFQLAGLLARGSMRSSALAERCGRPLYRSAAEVPGDVRVACAAMGRAAGPVVLDLVRTGIAVLAEHPVGESFVREALSLSRECGAPLHVNAHFGDLSGPRAFVRACEERSGGRAPDFIRLRVADRALYGAADLVGRALGAFTAGHQLEIRTSVVPDTASAFRQIDGSLTGTELSFLVQIGDAESADALPDGSPAYRNDCQIEAGFGDGILTLEALAGPVVWSGGGNGPRTDAGALREVLAPAAPDARTLRAQRIQANLGAMKHLEQHMETGEPPQWQTVEHLIGVANAWDQLARGIEIATRADGRVPG